MAIIHLGRQRHGADDIAAGERLNLIVWARSSAFRGAAAYGLCAPDGYPQEEEDGSPEKLCLSKSNDRDYALQLAALGDVMEQAPLPTISNQMTNAEVTAAAFAGAAPPMTCSRVVRRKE